MSKLPHKPHLTYQEQIEHLRSKGLIVSNPESAIKKLSHISYYRLSGYWLSAQRTSNGKVIDEFEEGVTFESICDFYLFDTRLRNLILYGIERVEIYLKSIIAYEIGQLDSIAYLNSNFINVGKYKKDYEKWIKKLNSAVHKSNDAFIKWNRETYDQIPIWVSIEIWDFGMLSKFYEILNRSQQNIIYNALQFSNNKDLKIILHGLNLVRNKCAHHSRLWDFKLKSHFPIDSIKTLELSALHDYMQNNKKNNSTKLAGIICAIWGITKQMTENKSWLCDVIELIKNHPNLVNTSIDKMGFEQGLTLEYLLNL